MKKLILLLIFQAYGLTSIQAMDHTPSQNGANPGQLSQDPYFAQVAADDAEAADEQTAVQSNPLASFDWGAFARSAKLALLEGLYHTKGSQYSKNAAQNKNLQLRQNEEQARLREENRIAQEEAQKRADEFHATQRRGYDETAIKSFQAKTELGRKTMGLIDKIAQNIDQQQNVEDGVKKSIKDNFLENARLDVLAFDQSKKDEGSLKKVHNKLQFISMLLSNSQWIEHLGNIFTIVNDYKLDLLAQYNPFDPRIEICQLLPLTAFSSKGITEIWGNELCGHKAEKLLKFLAEVLHNKQVDNNNVKLAQLKKALEELVVLSSLSTPLKVIIAEYAMPQLDFNIEKAIIEKTIPECADWVRAIEAPKS